MLRVFTFLAECVGWLQIAASPTIVALVLGAAACHYISHPLGMVIALAVFITGIVLGCIWATQVWKKKGTIRFLSRIMATPELDEDERKNVM